MKCRPHLGASRRLQSGQKIHSSALGSKYVPKAVLTASGEKPDWEKLGDEDQVIGVEEDLLDIISGAVDAFLENVEDDRALRGIETWLALGEQTTKHHWTDK